MKIKRIRIDSFGGVQRFSTPEMDDKLNLFYGPNESGKSSIAEFIRSTLFPSRFKYPVASKTDSGSIEVEMSDGDTRTLIREQKKVKEKDHKKTVEEEFPSLDADTYRSIYALDLDRLNDEKVLSAHDFKTKFLTIPGGERVPAVSEEIEEGLDELMTRDRLSEKTKIGKKLKDVRDIEVKISETRWIIENYDSLAVEKASLENKVAEKKKVEFLSRENEAKEAVLNAQKPNIEKLRELQNERNNVEKYRNFPMDVKKNYDSLKAGIEDVSKRIDDIPFGDEEENLVLTNAGRITEAWDKRPEYLANKDKIIELDKEIQSAKKTVYDLETESGYSVERSRKLRVGTTIEDMARTEITNRKKSSLSIMQRRLLGLLIIIGIAIVMVGLYLSVNKDFYSGSVSIIVGFIVVALACLIPVYVKPTTSEMGDWNSWIVAQGYPDKTQPEEALELSQKISVMNEYIQIITDDRAKKEALIASNIEYEKLIQPIFESLELDPNDFENSLKSVLSLLREVEDRKRMRPKSDLENELGYRTEELNKLLKKFGGEKEFLRQYECKLELDRLDNEIRMLTESIETSAGVPIGELMMFLDGYVDTKKQTVPEMDIDAMNKRIGELDAELRSVTGNNSLTELQQQKMDAEAELSGMLREWAVYAIARDIVANSCSHFYTDLEPAVIKTANRYLGIMTENRYKLDSDPRDNRLMVKDDYMKKSSAQWSSGLGDQIYLSIKMAMVKEMGTEEMPLILDDVLVRFDNDRKECACRAIYEFAQENQVLLFTCDSSLRNYFSLCGDYAEIRL